MRLLKICACYEGAPMSMVCLNFHDTSRQCRLHDTASVSCGCSVPHKVLWHGFISHLNSWCETTNSNLWGYCEGERSTGVHWL